MTNEDIKITAKCQKGRANDKNCLVIEINGKIVGYIQPTILDFSREHHVFIANVYSEEYGYFKNFTIAHTLCDAMEFCGIPRNLDPELPDGCYDEFYDWNKHRDEIEEIISHKTGI